MIIFILSDSNEIGSRVRAALVRCGHDVSPKNVVILNDHRRLVEARPDLVVFCLTPNPMGALEKFSAVREATPGKVIAVGPNSEARLIVRSLRAGADEFVIEEDLESELGEVLLRLQEKEAGEMAPGTVIAVLAASGGCGASTVAANTAAALAKDHGGCILIDLKLDTGDLAALFDIQPKHTIADLCSEGQIDRGMLEQVLTPHPSGVSLLASPRRQASFLDMSVLTSGRGRLTAGNVGQILSLARTMSPYVVVELSPNFREEQVHALRLADDILLVARLDFTSLRNARRAIEHLTLIEIESDRIHLIGNRLGQPQSVAIAHAEESLGVKFFHLIPDDPKTMNLSTNLGEPAVVGSAKSRSARSLVQLATSLTNAVMQE